MKRFTPIQIATAVVYFLSMAIVYLDLTFWRT
jgi:hypothetical protein